MKWFREDSGGSETTDVISSDCSNKGEGENHFLLQGTTHSECRSFSVSKDGKVKVEKVTFSGYLGMEGLSARTQAILQGSLLHMIKLQIVEM